MLTLAETPTDIPLSARLLLSDLRAEIGTGRSATYSHVDAARRIGISKRTVNRCLDVLAERGFITYAPGVGSRLTVVRVLPEQN